MTVESVQQDLEAIGVLPGSILLVHSSLSSLGWVCGGAVTVTQALKGAIGDKGTVVMPTHSGELSEPSAWCNPPVPRDWWPVIREMMPPYDPEITPTRKMGAIAECFRKQPGVLRSDHPQDSFAAYGPHARKITSDHRYHDGFGDTSPLGCLYDLKAWILLLGVGHDRNTSLHLAQVRTAGNKGPRVETGAPVTIDGERRWVSFSEPDLNDSEFIEIGNSFAEETGLVKSGNIGYGHALLMPQAELVDFSVRWMKRNRKSGAI